MLKFISMLIATILLSALAGCVTTGGYTTEPDYVAKVLDRTTFHTHESGESFDYFGGNANQFLEVADRSFPVLINVHGCGGVSASIFNMAEIGNELGMHVVIPDFLKRAYVDRACGSTPASTGRETRSYSRIDARRHEVDYLVRWLQKNRFKTIFVFGHSEGGTTVQGIKEQVSGVVISGMDCEGGRFWEPNPQNPLLVLHSSRDIWLVHWRPIVSCKSLLDRHSAFGEQFVSNGHTHRPTPLWDNEAKTVFIDFITRFR